MQGIIEQIRTLFASYSKEEIISVEKIPQSGSIRIYFIIVTSTKSFIASHGINKKENKDFI